MKMKNETRNVEHSRKAAIKNDYFFHTMVLKGEYEFITLLYEISKKYSPLKPNLGIQQFTAKRRFDERDKMISWGQEAFNLISYGKRLIFLEEIKAFRKKFFLGKEWEETLITYTMTGILCLPIFNLYIEKEEVRMPPSEGWGKLRVSLVLNPDTSLEDIESAWSEIEKAKQSLWPDFRKFNISKNYAKQLNEQIEVIREKLIPISDKEKYGAFSEWEEGMLKRGEPIKTVLQYRAKRKGQGLSSGTSNRIKSKRTNIDIVKKTQNIKSPKKARKAANLLSQHTRRLLKG
jgi:hypothetical protein